MTRTEICRRIEEVGIVPVVRAPSAELAIRASGTALLAGGISIFEITMTVPDAQSVIRSLTGCKKTRAVVGAGTVLAADDARSCIDAGAQLIVEPRPGPRHHRSRARGQRPSDARRAHPDRGDRCVESGLRHGEDLPLLGGGRSEIPARAQGSPPQVKMLPTGGVSLATVPEFIAAGAAALGIGTELVDIKALAAGQDALLTERARELVQAVAAARSR